MNKDNQNPEDKENSEPFIHEDGEFRTAFFGPVPDKIIESIPQKFDRKLISTLITQLTDTNARELKDEVLHTLKAGESQELLVEVIAMKEYVKHRQILLAACWESGLDFSNHLHFFIALLADKKTDDLSCVEIATIIDEMPGPIDNKMLDEALKNLETLTFIDPLRKELLTGIASKITKLKLIN